MENKRKNTNSKKWDLHCNSDNYTPLWIADFDYECGSFVKESLQKIVNLNIYGYTFYPEEYYQSFIDFRKTTLGIEIQRNHLLATNNITFGIAMLIQSFSKNGDNIILFTPIYNRYFIIIEGNQRNINPCPLVLSDNKYNIDFQLFESLCKVSKIFILCSPNNPISRVWTEEELEKIVSICKKYDVMIVSDEIHSNLLLFGQKYVSIYSFSNIYQNIACFYSPSKTFNIANLPSCFVISKSQKILNALEQMQLSSGLRLENCFSMEAAKACYQKGFDWILAVKSKFEENYNFLVNNLKSPEFEIFELQAGFLVWVRVEKLLKRLKINNDELDLILKEKLHLHIINGTLYGSEGRGFIRINIATYQDIILQCCKKLLSL